MMNIHTQKSRSAFSLIELMIVVAIIGVLAAIAIPNYTTYVVRAKVTELVGMTNAMKTEINEQFAVRGNKLVDVGISTGIPVAMQYVSGMKYEVNAAGDRALITINGRDGEFPINDFKILTVVEVIPADGVTNFAPVIKYTCGVPAADLQATFASLPATCRSPIDATTFAVAAPPAPVEE